jgi:hypothetical protein
MEGDPKTLGPPSEGGPGRQEARVLSPEEVARDFLRDGDSSVTQDTRSQASRRRRRNARAKAPTIAVVVGACAVLAGLAAFTLLPTGQPSAPPAQARSHSPAGGSVTTTTSTTSTSTSTSSTEPLLAHGAVKVDVLNAYGSGQLATVTAAALKQLGFSVGSVGNAPGDIAAGQPSQILYGPNALADADTLAQTLSGPVIETSTSNLSGNLLELWVASPQLTVKTS